MKRAGEFIQCAQECRALARELKDERERAMVLKWAEISSALAVERFQLFGLLPVSKTPS